MKSKIDIDEFGNSIISVWMPESNRNLDDVDWRKILNFGGNIEKAKLCVNALNSMMWNENNLFSLHSKFDPGKTVVNYEIDSYSYPRATFKNITYK